MKKKKILLLAFLFLFLYLTFNIYQKISYNPKKYFIKALTSLKNNYENISIDNYKFLNDNFTYSSNIKINLDENISSLIKVNDDYISKINFINNLDPKLLIKKKDNNYALNLNFNLNKEKYDFNIYLYDSNFYLKIDEDLIKLNDFEKILSLKDYKYYFNFLSKSFIKNIPNNYFKLENKKMTINDEEEIIEKSILNLDKEKLIKILNSIHKDIENDEKISKLISELNIDLEKYHQLIINNIPEGININFNTYIKSNKIIRYELELKNLPNISNIKIDNLMITFNNNDTINISINDKKIIDILNNKNDNESNIEIIFNNNKLFTIKKIQDKNKFEFTINQDLLFNNYFNLKSEYKEIDDSKYLINKLLLNLKILDIEALNLNIEESANITDEVDFDLDVSNAIDLNELKDKKYKYLFEKN